MFINFVKQQQEIVAESSPSAQPDDHDDGAGAAQRTSDVINMDELHPFVTSSGTVDVDILDDEQPTFHASTAVQVSPTFISVSDTL